MKFEFKWAGDFRGEDVWKLFENVDGRTTDGRTPE